jgi:NADH:ubiquinone oxidoreductase subunit 3 (subunit A)
MKLNLLFIVMDLLTILAYPIVFVYGKLRQFSKL